MNKLQTRVLKEYITRQLLDYEEYEQAPYTLIKALGANGDVVEQIMLLLERQAYVQPDELTLCMQSIDDLLEFAEDRGLSMQYGISSILESYVMSLLTNILEIDLLEWV